MRLLLRRRMRRGVLRRRPGLWVLWGSWGGSLMGGVKRLKLMRGGILKCWSEDPPNSPTTTRNKTSPPTPPKSSPATAAAQKPTLPSAELRHAPWTSIWILWRRRVTQKCGKLMRWPPSPSNNTWRSKGPNAPAEKTPTQVKHAAPTAKRQVPRHSASLFSTYWGGRRRILRRRLRGIWLIRGGGRVGVIMSTLSLRMPPKNPSTFPYSQPNRPTSKSTTSPATTPSSSTKDPPPSPTPASKTHSQKKANPSTSSTT
jgi:hypothetical protein